MNISELLNHSLLALILSPAITDQSRKSLPFVKLMQHGRVKIVLPAVTMAPGLSGTKTTP